MSLSVRVYDRGSWKVLEVSGRLDAFADKRVMASLRLGAGDHKWIGLDLQKCEFMSLWAMKSLTDWAEETSRRGGRLLVVSPSDNVQRQMSVFAVKSMAIFFSWESVDLEAYHHGWFKLGYNPVDGTSKSSEILAN